MALPGPTAEQKELIEVIRNKGLNELNQFLQNNPSIDLNFTFEIDKVSYSPLRLAVLHGDADKVKALIDKGANINIRDEHGGTLLHLAAYHGDSEVIDVLLTRGAVIDAQDNNENTPLHIAVAQKQIDAVKMLLEHKARIDVENYERNTPFNLANIMESVERPKTTEIYQVLVKAKEEAKVSKPSSGFVRIADSLSASASDISAFLSDPGVEPIVSVKQEIDDVHEDLFTTTTQSKSFTPSSAATLTATTSPKRYFDKAVLSQEQMQRYKELFPDNEDPYVKLAKIIKHQNEVASTSLEGKTANLQRRLKNIIPAVQFAVQGAREEYRQDRSNKELKARMEAFETIQDMLISLKSLTKNRSRYTKEHFDKRLNKIEQALLGQGIGGASAQAITDALRDVEENNTFNKRKFYQSDSLGMGSTPFDASQASMKVGDIRKRVKIEHNGKEVSAIFSYSRNKLLGQFSKKIWATRGGEFKNFQSQIRDFVNVAISEYGKGSQSNPIQISYIGPPQPEAAIMLLMEFKKRAILEGKTFYAKDKNGQTIEISPKMDFEPNERTYFMDYAMAHPQFAKESDLVATKGCAGYKVFKQGGVEMEKSEDRQDIQDAMDAFLDKIVGKSRAKLESKIEAVAGELEGVNSANSWKDNTARKAPKFTA